MIYISKGIVQEKSTERNIYVGRGGQVFQLTKVEAQLWLAGKFGFYETKNSSQERAIEHLYRMGLVEYESEDTLVARYRILTRCVLCAATNSNLSPVTGRFEASILNWLTKAGIRLSMAELVYLHERQIKATEELLYVDNRQKLVETIYTKENIFDNILECQMEHAACRDKVTAAVMVLLKNKKIVIL
ncbi:MAG: hypothetical protein Q4D44_00390 [Eubacteriales bacterium]|nr:hypothetical protein [Eubacteriales bacterium]